MAFLTIFLKLLIGLVGVVIVTRLLGKKEMSQVTPLDFVYALILGGIIEETMYSQTNPISEMLFALLVWGVLVYLLEKLTVKVDRARSIVKGTPTNLIVGGKVDIKAMKKAKMEIEQIRTLLRMKGVFSVSEVEYAILENSGRLSVMQKAGETPVTKKEANVEYKQSAMNFLVIEDGEISYKVLQQIGKDQDWLMNLIKEQNYELENIFFAEWSKTNGLYAQTF